MKANPIMSPHNYSKISPTSTIILFHLTKHFLPNSHAFSCIPTKFSRLSMIDSEATASDCRLLQENLLGSRKHQTSSYGQSCLHQTDKARSQTDFCEDVTSPAPALQGHCSHNHLIQANGYISISHGY
jgi:hypothetical protein